MHERLMRADDAWQEGDGQQDFRFLNHRVEVVTLLGELLADERLNCCQFYAYKEYKNGNGDSIPGGHANGSVSFQIRVGPGKVLISIVLFMSATVSSEEFQSKYIL